MLYDRSKEHQLLGSIDGKGLRLCDVAPYLLKEINHTTQIEGIDGPQPLVTYKSSALVTGPHRCAAILNRHEYGSRGELNRHTQGDIIPFFERDNQQFEVVMVIQAPPSQSVGFIGFHVPNNRGIKTGVEAELKRIFRENYDLKLELKPVVHADVIEAIETEGVGYVTFRKLNNPTEAFDNDDEWWTESEELGSVDLRLKSARKKRLFPIGRKISRFIQSRQGTLADGEEPVEFVELATFDEKTYEEIEVEIRLNGRNKVIRMREEGYLISHAFSWDLDVGIDASPDRLVAALADLLPDVDMRTLG